MKLLCQSKTEQLCFQKKTSPVKLGCAKQGLKLLGLMDTAPFGLSYIRLVQLLFLAKTVFFSHNISARTVFFNHFQSSFSKPNGAASVN
jgi:hypothetical protein